MTQRTRLWLVALVVGGLLTALPGVAVANSDTTDATDTPVSDEVSDVDYIKHRALHAIEKRLETVARLAKKVENHDTVTEEHAGKLLRDLADAAVGLEELARKIEAAATVEELNELVPLIATDFRIYQLVRPKVNQVLASDAKVAATERLFGLANTLEVLIDRAENAGYEVARPEKWLRKMRRNLTAAAELAGPVADMVIDLQPEDWPDPAKATLREGEALLEGATTHLRIARHKAKKIIRWLRNLADPPIDVGELD